MNYTNQHYEEYIMDTIKLTKPNGEEVKIFKDNNKIIIRFFNDDDSLCCPSLSQKFTKDELKELIQLLLTHIPEM